MKSPERGMTSSREATEELRSIILLRKVLPAGTTLAAKLRVPIRESSSRLEQLELVAHVSREWCRSWSLLGGRWASREAE